MDPLEKVNQMETDIVYIGKAKRIGGPKSTSSPWNCRLYDYYSGKSSKEVGKVEFMRSLTKDGRHIIPYRGTELSQALDGVHKTTISWLPCLNEPIAKQLERALLNAFWKDHKTNPPLNRTPWYSPSQIDALTDTKDKVREMIQEMKTQNKVG